MAEKLRWITVKGRHVQVDDKGKLVADRPKKKHVGYKSSLDKENKYSPKERKKK